VLVRNLGQNTGRRFDRVSQRCNDRTRQLNVGFREAKSFDDARNQLLTWIDNAATSLAETEETGAATEPEKLRSQISAHKDFQRSLGSKQSGQLICSSVFILLGSFVNFFLNKLELLFCNMKYDLNF